LGCIFTQTTWDEEGHPIRDPDSTTYVGAIEPADPFGKRLDVEALFQAPCRLSISFTRVNIFGSWRANCSIRAKSKSW
jgi:hypothetical protein